MCYDTRKNNSFEIDSDMIFQFGFGLGIFAIGDITNEPILPFEMYAVFSTVENIQVSMFQYLPFTIVLFHFKFQNLSLC